MNKEKLESGVSPGIKQTTYTATKKDGTKMVEKITKDKESGEITSHTVDGEEVEKKPKKQPTVLQYSPSNAEFIQIKLLEMISNQLKEINYYLRLQVEDKIDDKKVEEEING